MLITTTTRAKAGTLDSTEDYQSIKQILKTKGNCLIFHKYLIVDCVCVGVGGEYENRTTDPWSLDMILTIDDLL